MGSARQRCGTVRCPGERAAVPSCTGTLMSGFSEADGGFISERSSLFLQDEAKPQSRNGARSAALLWVISDAVTADSGGNVQIPLGRKGVGSERQRRAGVYAQLH